ncbi:hypothetical protein K504DRAFT_468307 [Pleomassaria siparia CBS 279.74]|uniref:Uncharacterized protein n=1 Tax=Pleomassaria siparia CBS 279.74 TaxID=1314801 RepID=A0A6G1K9J1_9PLEO|nr:hypothetical protein K504DRAFT_468307 [Pleomassaria siparia CBS 279.74]
MPIRTPQSQVQPREQSDISSSSIQAIETDTIDLAHEIQGSPERDLHEGTRNSGSTAQLRAFSHSKPLSQRTPRLTLVLKSPSQKRKSLGMFGGMPERKHARLGSRHTSTQTGERPVSNSALVTTTKEAVPLPASDDEESLFIPETTATQAALLRRDQTSESVPTYRQVRKALRRHRTPDSVIGPSSPPETPKKEPEAPDVDEQVRRYLEMESLIRTSTVEVQRLKTYIKEYKQEEGALELGLQALDKEADNKKQEVLANAALKKDEVRKRLEAEMAAIDMEAASSVNQITAGTPKEKTILEGVVERRVKEELRITQKTRILEDTEAALEALQKAGGFKLGVAVMAKKQQD